MNENWPEIGIKTAAFFKYDQHVHHTITIDLGRIHFWQLHNRVSITINFIADAMNHAKNKETATNDIHNLSMGETVHIDDTIECCIF